MSSIGIKKAVLFLFSLGIILTPVFGLQEWMTRMPVLSGLIDVKYVFFIKLIKDVLLGTMCILFFIDVLRGGKFINNLFVWFFITVITISFLITSINIDPFLGLIGLRVFSPFILIVIAYKYLDMDFVRKLVAILTYICVFEFFVAAVEMVYGVPYYGYMYLKLASRPFGTFVRPWSLAGFICFVICLKLALDIYMFKRVNKKTWAFVAVSTVFVFMTGSGSGILTLLVITIIYFYSYSKTHIYVKAAFFFLLLIALPLIFMNLDVLTGRADIYDSIMTRVGIFDKFTNSMDFSDIIIGKGLGIGSNAAVTLLRLRPIELEDSDLLFISDSLYTSLISQAGLLFLIVFIAFNIYLFYKACRDKYEGINPFLLLTIPLVFVMSMGNSIVEFFPVNWLIFMFYGLGLNKQKI